jgi:hypothetical protein
MDELQGNDSELFHRLADLIADEPAEVPHWFYNNAAYAAMAVGSPYPSRDEQSDGWMPNFVAHLERLRSIGAEEAFLVSAVLDFIEGYYESGADVERWGRNRAKLREHLEQQGHDVAEIEHLLRAPDAESSTTAWAERDAWRRQCARYLDDDQIDLWRVRSIRPRRGY